MKKATKITGFIATFLLVAGAIFKIMHWPGAGPALVLGAALFSLVFLPLWMMGKLKEEPENKLFHITGFFTFTLVCFGVLFKIQHWPGATIMLLAGTGMLFLIYLPVYYFSMKKLNRPVNYTFIYFTMAGASLIIALGARSVSTSILNSFVVLDENIKQTSGRLAERNNAILAAISKNAPEKLEKAEEVRQLSADMNNYISELRTHLISITDKRDENTAKNISLLEVNSKDNYDEPTRILIGSEPANPINGAYSATELKNNLNNYREKLLTFINKADREKISSIIRINTDDVKRKDLSDSNDKELIIEKWELANFYHMPLSAVVSILSQLETEVRFAEGEALNHIYYEAGKNLTTDKSDKE